MKRFEFAGPALLLSAWLLMQAPKLQDPGGVAVDHSRATIKWWQQVHAFDSARDCEETRVKDVVKLIAGDKERRRARIGQHPTKLHGRAARRHDDGVISLRARRR